MKDRIYIKVTALLLIIACLSLGATALFSPKQNTNSSLRIVTSFYPVYIAACNVAGGIDGVQVINMVDSQTGCLHDYQMSPEERAVLESADILVMNGAGAEPFLDAVLPALPSLTTVDLSKGQSLLESGHVHEHEHDHDHEHEETITQMNSHLWVSPPRYRLQIETLTAALIEHDPAHAAEYTKNAAAYLQEIDTVWARLQQAATKYTQVPSVLFHDSLAYLAEDLGLTVIAALNVGEDSGVSASLLAKTEDVLRGKDKALFFYDNQYETVQYAYLREIPAAVTCLTVDTVVAGEENLDAWLDAMTALCREWEAAV